MINLGNTKDNKPVIIRKNALTTHAVVLGATGSGKTGALLGMVEELVHGEVPVILVDIKGDMINIAQQDNTNMVVRCLTPGAFHGEPVNVFADLEDPSKVTLAASTLLRLAGEKADPLQSRAHTYLSTILEKKHRDNEFCDLVSIIESVQEPGFTKLGAMDLDFAFPKRSRINLATKLNNLLVAPSFRAWREGVPMALDSLLEPAGRVPVVIYSVAHLVDQEEQAFALGLLLEEVLRWTRRQPGSQDLRTALVIDECVGLIPPHPKNPPTKKPLMLLLKQARAFGVGCVLATQNPVDLDYKAMSNCSTWLIGRLSMDKDRDRVITNVCSEVNIPQSHMEQHMSSLQNREFLLVRPTGTATFRTKDVNCALTGPMAPEAVEDLYRQEKLAANDVNKSLSQQLEEARIAWKNDPNDENIGKMAQLEKKLGVFDTINFT